MSGGYCPGRIIKKCRRKMSKEYFVMGVKNDGRKKCRRKMQEENVAGGKFLGGFCNSVISITLDHLDHFINPKIT